MAANTSPRARRRRIAAAGAAFAVAAGLLATAIPASANPDGRDADRGHGHGRHHGRTVDVQLLSFNDFHGNLEPPQGSSGEVAELQPDGTTKEIPAGGVEYLASSLRDAREGHRYSVTAAAGDLVGASPLLSGLFHDEPTVEAMNKLDLDVTSVGNHEFDEGIAELTRLQDGGCHPEDGCYVDGRRYRGADFPYLAANVTDEDTGRPVLEPYTIWKHRGVRIGFIGVTLEGTPDIVSAEGVKGLEFHDEVETIDRYAKKLKRRGVNAVVALVHEGGAPAGDAYNYDCDSPGPGDGISGPIAQIAKNTTPMVDAFVTGHTHEAYACTIPDPKGAPRTVTSAASYGRLFTDTTLTYDRRTRDIVRTSVDSANHVVSREQPKARDMTRLIGRWNELAAPVANRPVGWIGEDIPGRGASTPESPLGDLIADAQLAHAQGLDAEADLALMNPGGIRSDLVYGASGSEGDGVVTYAEGFTVQPFANTVNMIDLTGAQLLQVLREQVSGDNAESPKVLQVSEGFSYTLDLTRSGADRVVADSVRLNGEAIQEDATYRVAVNNFLAGGGDGFPTLAEGANPYVGGNDLDVLVDYMTANSSESEPLQAPAADRITVVE
ncbi:bifunctional metallophosphatase/5'-nucleotidase [Streptomyces sp. RKND-216]|uniref:bifunctional metallophosphatase/5'-nucleotidase n=1 Tax=Streptomyces sp. RKND-216 TaxID=2562581 RepID=UPI00109D8476|nr:bifunctional metallophosphatase/5'-nucleotidase [Streptomyces sp. RKND-216]THA25752.1 bifunctional metallophosphatase/5'-nucleotidase [Streptomyces sp. RKND-216]